MCCARDSIEITHRDQEDEVQANDKEDCPHWGLQCIKSLEDNDCKDESNNSDGQEPPIGDFLVVSHHLGKGVVEAIIYAALAIHEMDGVMKCLLDISFCQGGHGLLTPVSHTSDRLGQGAARSRE